MKAILFAAGLGTRLRPLINDRPKCLVDINGTPLLGLWLKKLIAEGFGPFLVNTHYLADHVVAYIEKSEFCDRVTLAHEEQLLGTGGTLKKNLTFFDGEEDCLVMHADNYTTADISALRTAHKRRPEGCEGTMMTFSARYPEKCGIVSVNEEGVMTEFHEKSILAKGNQANTAIYIFNKSLLCLIKSLPEDFSDISTELLPSLTNKIHCYHVENTFFDVGTPRDYRTVQKIALTDPM